ncbi:MAG: selenium cofactor biosynthesis protein YqeC [Anaerolineales bacterium]
MKLSRALRVEPGQAIAFTGAGGKTSAIRRLAIEVVGDQCDNIRSILITTTTRLGREQQDLAVHHLIDPAQDEIVELPVLLAQHRSVLVTGPALEDKWIPPTDDVVDELHRVAEERGALLVIEADGARGRSVKAPAKHEPVIPPFVDMVVPMAGLDALGQTIQSDVVHRTELVAALLKASRKSELSPTHLAKLLAADKGGLKGIPEGAEVRIVLNKAEGSVLEIELAQSLLKSAQIRAVVLSSLTEEDPVRQVHGRVAGVVLAAGGSSRLGEPKQLIEWRGQPLIWHAVQAAAALNPVVVVVGEVAQEVQKALKREPVDVIANPDWEAGQSGSLRMGLDAVSEGTEAVIFLLGDMPFVGQDLVGALLERYHQTLAPIVATWAGGRRANPVLFDRETYSDLFALEGDQGGRKLFKRFERQFIEWDESILFDVDTPRDLQRLRGLE